MFVRRQKSSQFSLFLFWKEKKSKFFRLPFLVCDNQLFSKDWSLSNLINWRIYCTLPSFEIFSSFLSGFYLLPILANIFFLIGWILQPKSVHEYGKFPARKIRNIWSQSLSRSQFLSLNTAPEAVFTDAKKGIVILDFSSSRSNDLDDQIYFVIGSCLFSP